VFDCETKCEGAMPDPTKDEFKYLGAYSYEDDEYYFLSDKAEIKALFKKHRVLVSFNGYHYDEPILKRSGLWNSHCRHLDLRVIIKKRANLLGCVYESKSLSNLAKFFKLEVGKGELDYDLLKKDFNTPEELKLIKEYTLQDIKVTKEMFDYVHDFFEPFKEYMNRIQVRRYEWLTTTIASYTYKVFCNKCNLKEEYADKYERVDYEGGYVSETSVDEAHRKIICFDFSSLYPFDIIQNNLVTKDKYKLGKIEQTLLDFYKQRLKYKSVGDRREYVIKIIINSFYGMLGSPIFQSVHNYEAAKACTKLGRSYVKHARKLFKDFGYEVLYTDTDSVYIRYHYPQTKQTAEQVADVIVKQLQVDMPFPSDLFKLKVDDEIKHIYFFKHGDKRLKKLYIYVTEEDKIVVKGLPMIKNDSSKIGYEVFKNIIQDRLITGERYITETELKTEALRLLNKNINYAKRVFYVRGNYKNDTQLQARIEKRHGIGRHELIGNNKIGVGCSTKYCTETEFREHNLTVEDINLNKFWKEMNFFLEEPHVEKKLRTNNRTKQTKEQKTLMQWGGIK